MSATGRYYDILRPENQAQVIRTMWDDPASELWPKIECPALIVPAGPSPERANTDFARTRKRMVELAAAGIPKQPGALGSGYDYTILGIIGRGSWRR